MRKILIFIIITVLSLTSCDFTNDEYEGSNDIEKLLSWKPDEKQWWITGFNPEYVGDVDVHKQVMVGKVDMSQFEDSNGENAMFDSLVDQYELGKSNHIEKWNCMYFDKNSHTVWIIWGDK